jgi:hypothetical protein
VLLLAPNDLTSLKSRAHTSLVNAGGGPGRNWAAPVISHGVRCGHCTAAGMTVGT